MVFLYERRGLIVCQSDSEDVEGAFSVGLPVERYVVDYLLSERYNLTISRRSNGSPFLVGDDRSVSISHTKDIVALYVSDNVCGVDIEFCSRNASRVSRKFTDSDEISVAQSVYSKNAELLIWCAKEALYKMCGVDGAEFKSDFRLVSSYETTLECSAFGNLTNLSFFELDDLLVVHTSAM